MYINHVLNKEFFFIGDKLDEGGNDYPVGQYCEQTKGNHYFQSWGIDSSIQTLIYLLSTFRKDA